MNCSHKKTIIIAIGLSYACLNCGKYNFDGAWYNFKDSFSRLYDWATEHTDRRHKKIDYEYFMKAIKNSRRILRKFYLKKEIF